jgi:uncharacterized protein YbjT (DUF2867 family)
LQPFGKEEVMNIAIVGATGLIGSQLVSLAKSRGHEVIALSIESGTDVIAPEGLEALAGAEAMVDVTQSPSLSEQDATAFFTRAAENLGKAATEARVRRSVVLSIIGVDKIAAAETEPGTGFDGYYRAKFAHEQATLAFAPGPHVVRSSQFHDIARQAIGWGRDGDRSTISDLTIQPVAVSAMVEVLLAAATGAVDAEVTEVAGPQLEQLRTSRPGMRPTSGTPSQSSPRRWAMRCDTASFCPDLRLAWSVHPLPSGWLPCQCLGLRFDVP